VDEAGDVRILLGDALGGIHQQQHHVGIRNGLQGFDHRELLDGLEHLALAAQAGGVDQLETLAVALERHGDGVAGGARHVERHQALLTQPGVDERGFAHVGTTGHRQADGALGRSIGQVLILFRLRQVFQGQLDQATHTLPVGGRDGQRLANAQLMELRQLGGVQHAFGLVGHQQHLFA